MNDKNVILYGQDNKEAMTIGTANEKHIVIEVSGKNYHYATVKLFSEAQIKVEVRMNGVSRSWSDLYLFEKNTDGKFVLKNIDGNIFAE